MKYLVLTAILLGTATLAAAQAPAPTPANDIPKVKCEPKPSLPSARMLEEPSVRKRFQNDLDAYKKCMTTYLDARNAAIKANQEAANVVVEEYNKTMKELQDAQKNQ